MKITVVGGFHVKYDIPENYKLAEGESASDHSICSATLALTKSLSLAGYNAEMWQGGSITGDLVICNEFNFMDLATKRGWDISKPTIVWLHSTRPSRIFSGEELVKKAAGICFTRKEAMNTFKAKFGGKNLWHLPWGFPDWWTTPPTLPNPYAPNTKNIIYAGRLMSGPLPKRLNEIAKQFKDVQVNVITNTPYKNCSQFMKEPNINFIGSKVHGTFNNYIYYADLAIDMSLSYKKESNNCKIWDYLALGCPIVTDYPLGGDEIIHATGNGILVPFRQREIYMEAVKKVLNSNYPREKTIEYMRNNYAYDKIFADKLIPKVKVIVNNIIGKR